MQGGRDTQVTIVITADKFLYRMVRNIVECLVRVGAGSLSASGLQAILLAADKRLTYTTAPPQGLYLVNVDYCPEVMKRAVLSSGPHCHDGPPHAGTESESP